MYIDILHHSPVTWGSLREVITGVKTSALHSEMQNKLDHGLFWNLYEKILKRPSIFQLPLQLSQCKGIGSN